jgi:hypothetical protein
VTDYALASESITDNILEFQTGEEIIGAHVLLLLELQNITEDTNNNSSSSSSSNNNNNTYITCPTQLQKLIRYKWNNYAFNERLHDTAGRIYMCGIQDVITKGKVDETVCMLYGILSLKNGITGMISNVKEKDRS